MDICGGGYLRRWIPRWCARYRLRGGALDHCNQKECSRYRLRAGGAGPLHSKGVCTISFARGVAVPLLPKGVDHCNQRVCARYRLRGGVCWTAAIEGGARDIVCERGVLDHCTQRVCARYRSRRGGAIKGCVRDIVCTGVFWTTAIKGGVALSREARTTLRHPVCFREALTPRRYPEYPAQRGLKGESSRLRSHGR